LVDADKLYLDENGISAVFLRLRGHTMRKISYDRCYCTVRERKQADFIIGAQGLIDVIVELKGSDTNLKGSDDRSAARQVEATLHDWRKDQNSERRIAALIVFGRIEGKKKGAGRRPRARSAIQTLEVEFLRRLRVLLLVRESGEKQFRFTDFMPRKNGN
jgi:hypothetical protein